MPSHSSGDKLLRPHDAVPAATANGTRGLSADILSRSARRLRILALMYAFTFFMAAFVPNLILAEPRAQMAADFGYFVPDIVAIVLALLVAAFTLYERAPLTVVLNVGLAFLVISNYGIAVAEYLHPSRLDNNGWIGLSWVAVWTPLYTVVVPTRPRKALIATLASVSSVPVI